MSDECFNVRVVCIFFGLLGDDFLVFVCVESGASVLDSENILETRLYIYNMNGLINVDLTLPLFFLYLCIQI